MEYFVLLAAATAVIGTLAIVLYRKRRDAGLLVGFAALYYWSLYGAWYLVIDKTGGFSGKSYHYLEQKLFPMALDNNYLATLGLYSGFIVLIELTLLAALSRRRAQPVPRLLLRHTPLLTIGFLAALGSFYFIGDRLTDAWALDMSAYRYTRTDPGRWFTLHQVLNRVALIPPAIGFATLLAGKRSRYFVNVTRRYTFAAYVALFGCMGVFTFVLGNKNEVLTALLTGVLTYVASVRRPNLAAVGLTVACGLWFLYTIDLFRGVPIDKLGQAVTEQLENATEVARFVTSSNEAYGAHFSMYAVLTAGTEPRFAYSLYSLACSVIPRAVWPDRPRDIYLYYSESIGAIDDQAYSIHHATGWYLNFSYTGVAIGAIVLGFAWAYCLNAHQRIRARSGLIFRLFATIAPWVFVACLPPLVRAGPEGYKGLAVDGFLIPMAALAFACRPKRARRRWRIV